MSVLNNPYKTVHDVQQYLSWTILRYDGEPVYVGEGGVHEGEIVIDLHDVVTNRHLSRIGADDPRLDVSSIPLGYFNSHKEDLQGDWVYYAYRSPCKRYKQGLSQGNITCVGIASGCHHGFEFLKSQGFVDSVKGIFPNFSMGLNMLLGGERTQVALSRHIAIEKKRGLRVLVVHYQGEPVGHIEVGSAAIQVGDLPHFWAFERAVAPMGLQIIKTAA